MWFRVFWVWKSVKTIAVTYWSSTVVCTVLSALCVCIISFSATHFKVKITDNDEMTCPGYIANMWLTFELRSVGLNPNSELSSYWIRIRAYSSASVSSDSLVLGFLLLGQSLLGQTPGILSQLALELFVYTYIFPSARAEGAASKNIDLEKERI